MDQRIEQVTTDLQKAADDTRAAFGGLSLAQLNWKPAEKSWSVAQCLDHLIVTHERFFPILTKYADGRVDSSLWEKISPFSGFFGRFLIKGLDPANMKKMKTTSRGQPSASEIDRGIIDRYGEHQKEFIGLLKRLPADLDLKKAIVTSPMLAVFTYSLDDWLTIAVIHGQRHFNQARRVMESTGAPEA